MQGQQSERDVGRAPTRPPLPLRCRVQTFSISVTYILSSIISAYCYAVAQFAPWFVALANAHETQGLCRHPCDHTPAPCSEWLRRRQACDCSSSYSALSADCKSQPLLIRPIQRCHRPALPPRCSDVRARHPHSPQLSLTPTFSHPASLHCYASLTLAMLRRASIQLPRAQPRLPRHRAA